MKKFLTIALCATVALASCSKSDDETAPVSVRGAKQLSENFEGNAVNTSVNYPGWSVLNVTNTIDWKTKEYNKNKYVEVTAFNSNAGDYESWYVSPALNVTDAKNKNVTFEVAYGYWNDNTTLEVYVMTDSLAKTAPVKLNATIPTKENVEFGFYNSGVIDLSKYTGTIYIGFKYKAKVADDKKASTFRIENFRFNYEPVKGDAVANPLTVTEVLATQDKSVKWVKGFIVGVAAPNSTGNGFTFKTPIAAGDVTNIILAPSKEEKDPTKCIAVKLLAGTPRTTLGLGTNPTLINTEVSVRGVLNSSFGQAGMTDAMDFKK